MMIFESGRICLRCVAIRQSEDQLAVTGAAIPTIPKTASQRRMEALATLPGGTQAYAEVNEATVGSDVYQGLHREEYTR